MEGVEFEILEEITTTKHANFYTQLIAFKRSEELFI